LTGQPEQPLIVILGPTAIGKTGLAIELAQAINGEIIGADSRQVYQHMDIGTAKPTPEQRAQVPHHLVDFIDPADNLTLARYQALAYAAVDDIHARGRVPLLVGGTGQYITAVTEGWRIPEVPPDDAFRTEMEAFAAAGGRDELYKRLEQIDPVAAQKIHPNNVRRVIRALEVHHITGERMSDLQGKIPPPYTIMELGLTLERLILYGRADLRVELMVQHGLVAEVERLLASRYPRTLPSMSSLGYPQFAAHVNGECTLEQAIEETQTATHDFIRRQLTWFRGHDNGILWHNVAEVDTYQIIYDCVGWLNGKRVR